MTLASPEVSTHTGLPDVGGAIMLLLVEEDHTQPLGTTRSDDVVAGTTLSFPITRSGIARKITYDDGEQLYGLPAPIRMQEGHRLVVTIRLGKRDV